MSSGDPLVFCCCFFLCVFLPVLFSFPTSPHRTVTYGQRSFRFESVRVWNSLPNEYRTAMSFREFKGLIRTWVGPRCNCAMCGS